MPWSKFFRFVEKNIDGVALAVERDSGRVFRMDGRSLDRWVEITDRDHLDRIGFYGAEISEDEAMRMADELEADLAAMRHNAA